MSNCCSETSIQKNVVYTIVIRLLCYMFIFNNKLRKSAVVGGSYLIKAAFYFENNLYMVLSKVREAKIIRNRQI